MHLSYLLYASELSPGVDHSKLNGILSISQRNNAKHGLSGFLHVEDQRIVQFLEGPYSKLRETLERIQRDNRHRRVQVLSEGAFPRRYFQDWTMAMVDHATFSLADLKECGTGNPHDMTSFDPMDLINMLSTNASYLRGQPHLA